MAENLVKFFCLDEAQMTEVRGLITGKEIIGVSAGYFRLAFSLENSETRYVIVSPYLDSAIKNKSTNAFGVGKAVGLAVLVDAAFNEKEEVRISGYNMPSGHVLMAKIEFSRGEEYIFWDGGHYGK